MAPSGSLPCSQEPATGPYSEPDESIAYTHALFLLRSVLILSSHISLRLPSGLFSGFPARILYTFFIFPMHAVCPAYLILDSITLIIGLCSEQHKLWSSPLRRFLQPLPLPLSQVEIFFSAPCSQTHTVLNLCSSLRVRDQVPHPYKSLSVIPRLMLLSLFPLEA